MILIAPIAASLLQLAVSRQREYLADATAARMLGTGEPLAEALETLERGRQALPMQVNPATDVALHRQPAAAARASRHCSRPTRRSRSASRACASTTATAGIV